MKKKNKKYLYTVLGFILLLSIYFIFYFNTQQMSLNVEHANSQLVSENEYSATYKFSFSGPNDQIAPCDTSRSVGIDSYIISTESESSRPKLAENLQTDKYFITQDVVLNGIKATVGTCSDNARDVQLVYDNLSAECKVNPGANISGEVRANVECAIKGLVHAEDSGEIVGASFYKFSDGYAQFTVLKAGIECINEEKCINSIYYTCENYKLINKGEVIGKCGVTQTSNQTNNQTNNSELPTYYRYNNINCTSIQIASSDKTSQDFTTLYECQQQLPSTTNPCTLISCLEGYECERVTEQTSYSDLVKEVTCVKKDSTSWVIWGALVAIIGLISTIIFLIYKRKK